MAIKPDKFVLSIIAVLVVSYLFPDWGVQEDLIPINLITTIGVSLIFFFYGVKLSPSKLKEGLSNWKLHVLIQASTFVIFPFLVLLTKPLIATESQEIIWLAFFFLAALPF